MDRGTYRLYRTTPSIIITAAMAVVFGLRASMSEAGTASLSGPAWTTFDIVVAVLAVISCFDRIVVTDRGITMVRVGIPRRVPADRIHRLVRTDAGGIGSRLYAETVDGNRTLITAERRNAMGKLRVDELCNQAREAFGASLEVALVPGLTPAPPPPSSASERRRCVRSGCSAYLAEVTTRDCEVCGGRTQQIPA